ncbi:transcriptional repressor general negative regulator of transcription subunit 4 [Basidiobolus ranarum]|uniref:Transcriptional repressor general negative regulator of transcription subunit 4 n=1 Tax=Basidiobolus ranarum TaxID=34480 RepID=A0ABR2VWQ7_9FUNG
MSDLEDYDCPLCMEELDISERNFKPCPCGYQICRFCWHHIKEELNGKCPACRRSYSDENVQFTPITSTEFSRIKTEKKCKEREKKEIESTSRKHLTNVRVVQKNLIYVIGLTARVTEEVLRSSDYFGQYGKITKIVINRRHAQNSTSTHPGQTPTIGVYVTYARREDAAKAIAAVDGSMSDGRILRATYGTTKYCTYYLRNMPCQNPNCMYLHEPGEEADTFTREDLASGKHNIKDHHAQLEHLSPKPQTLGTHSTSLLLSPSEQGDSPSHKLETPVVVYRSESKSSDGDTEGSALPPTASWAKVSTKKSALSTAKSPPLSLNQFPPPPAAGRPKAKVISLSKSGKSELKPRTSSEEEDENDKKRIEVTKMVSGVADADAEPKIAISHATLAPSNSLEDNHQGAEKHQSNGNGQIVAQKETSKISNSVSNLFEEADKEANLKEQAQKISNTVPQARHNLVNEERLHQEVMAELERERAAFDQQKSRRN